MDKSKLILLIILSLLLIGCEDSLNDKMNGLWLIEKIYIKDVDYINNLSINTISFTKENVSIPRVNIDSNMKNEQWKDEKAEWESINYGNSDTIAIKSYNKVFNGRYELTFSRDIEDNSIYAKLVGREKIIILHKVEFSIW
ncbi:MAG: hypothetical protein COZ75_08775 [Flavobacteriaceae bacterium CG_4_8_14_3_um_filter_34_10]|nr:MAG: hypothetical protein COZ75_08775 [Flavobacteriaceae bacterium CG_4_8_14_3_um_filter_34_10]